MQTKQVVRLFKNGRSQAVRIPKGLELPGSEATIYREGDRLVIEPRAKPTLAELLASWEKIDEEFPEIDDPPPDPVEF